jgi:hypothetical protein
LQQELVTKYKDRWEKLKEKLKESKKKRVNKQAEELPPPSNENSFSKSNSTTISHKQPEHNQNTPSPTSQSQSAVNVQPLQQSPSSPGTKLPFALQNSQGVVEILDDPSNLKNNNNVFSTPQRHTAPLIIHATSTGPNKLNADRMNLNDSTDSIDELLSSPLAFLPHSQQNRQISGESIIPPISSVANLPLSTRRESAPAIHTFDNSSSTTSNSTSQSMYHDLTTSHY